MRRMVLGLTLAAWASTARADSVPVKLTVAVDPRDAHPLQSPSPRHPFHEPRFVATLTNVSRRPIVVTHDQDAILVHSMEYDGHVLLPSVSPEDDEITSDPQRDGVVELAPGQQVTFGMLEGVLSYALDTTSPNAQTIVSYDVTKPGKYTVSFEYRYYRAAKGGRPARGFRGVARSNPVTFEIVR